MAHFCRQTGMQHEARTDYRLWELIGRKFSGEASHRELDELEVLLQLTPGALDCYCILAAWWKEEEQDETPTATAIQAFERLMQRIGNKAMGNRE